MAKGTTSKKPKPSKSDGPTEKQWLSWKSMQSCAGKLSSALQPLPEHDVPLKFPALFPAVNDPRNNNERIRFHLGEK
jgi:hypothetical protein